MATGDLRNNLKKLRKQVQSIRYNDDIDHEGLAKGEPNSHLPILYHLFFDYNPNIAGNAAKLGYDIAGKRGADFVQTMLKLLREMNPTYHQVLKVNQFMANGFAERKIILTSVVIDFVKNHQKLTKSDQKNVVKCKSACGVNKTPGRAGTSRSQSATSETQMRGVCGAKSSVNEFSSTVKSSRVIAPPDAVFASSIFSTDLSVIAPVGSAKLKVPGPAGKQRKIPPAVIRHSNNDSPGFPPPECESVEEDIAEKEDNDEEVFQLIMAVSDEVTKLKIQNEDFFQMKKLMEELQEEVKHLTDENSSLKLEIDELKGMQQQNIDLNTIIARLDVHEARLTSVESKERQENEIPSSPVCGKSLCGHMHNLNLLQDDHEDSQNENSTLLDVSNTPDAPRHAEFRGRNVKLLKALEETRTLLGLKKNLDDTATEENQQEEGGEEAENKMPNVEEIS